MDLAGKKIILGLTGSVACYKIAELTRLLIQQGASLDIVMTTSACRFITPMTMQALSGKPVYISQWDDRTPNHMPHINLSRDADAIIIAPCSANFIFKLAHGACDDLLSTICIAKPLHVPILIAPAMNVEMWENPATQRNIIQVEKDNVTLLGPQSGMQACGEEGMGRMLEPAQLLEKIIASFQTKILAGKNVLITAGPTYEAIDPVRGITNLSSGKMGYAIARAAQQVGANVQLISGPTALTPPDGVHTTFITSAQEMFDAVFANINKQDIFISVAAVADWKITNAHPHKYKKENNTTPTISLAQNPDILASVSALTNKPFCVGFAAESENLITNGTKKRIQKNIPLLVGNIGPKTFGRDDNELILFDEKGHTTLAPATKNKLAQQLISEIVKRM